ncbi:MAG: hypothetical protein K6A63_00265 [Acholeplasmatales bacterium]|nr:hypothetical protein [Acholeplasmatales bacterium]
MAHKFNSLPRLIQFILLLIPVVNWVVEVVVRISAVIERTTLGNILGLIFGLIIPVFGWLDLVWVLLFKHMILANA